MFRILTSALGAAAAMAGAVPALAADAPLATYNAAKDVYCVRWEGRNGPPPTGTRIHRAECRRTADWRGLGVTFSRRVAGRTEIASTR
jgi:hypothetical protein